MEENFNYYKDQALEFAPTLALALLVLFIGFFIANKIANLTARTLQKRDVDKTVVPFIKSLISVGIKIMVVIAAAGMVGVEVASFIAIFGALVFAIGMALQGSLGHFASGLLLLIFKPYRVGDLVEIGGGKTGAVEEIQIFNTVLKTLDNKRIFVPNGVVTSNVITNISGQDTIGVELTFGIGYDDDIDQAKDIILKVGKECPWILDDPAQGVVVAELADSSVNLATRPFCKSEDYWNTFFYMQENIKKQFDAAGIGIPFPQMDVHIQNN